MWEILMQDDQDLDFVHTAGKCDPIPIFPPTQTLSDVFF